MAGEYRIPFNRSALLGREQEYIARAMANGQIGGDQEFTKRCERFLEQAVGCHRALITTSCTHALEMSGMLLGIGAGDEVIVPSFTFVSTANAFAMRGAKVVFADIRPDTLNLDEKLLPDLITDRTRAVAVVHYAGVGCAMDTILGCLSPRGIPVVEDNAHGLFGRYRGRYLGTFGALATQSFHETKNLTCGEGGALLLNDERYVERAEILREKGTNRSKFFKGQVDKYTWVDIGSSFVMSDVLAAFLFGQFEMWEMVQQRRRKTWENYDSWLGEWADRNGVGRPGVPAECEQAYHMYYLILPNEGLRDSLIAHLREQGILSVFHYLPLHLSPMGRRLGGREGQCPVTEEMSRRLVRLPFYNELTSAQQEFVVQKILSWTALS